MFAFAPRFFPIIHWHVLLFVFRLFGDNILCGTLWLDSPSIRSLSRRSLVHSYKSKGHQLAARYTPSSLCFRKPFCKCRRHVLLLLLLLLKVGKKMRCVSVRACVRAGLGGWRHEWKLAKWNEVGIKGWRTGKYTGEMWVSVKIPAWKKELQRVSELRWIWKVANIIHFEQQHQRKHLIIPFFETSPSRSFFHSLSLHYIFV